MCQAAPEIDEFAEENNDLKEKTLDLQEQNRNLEKQNYDHQEKMGELQKKNSDLVERLHDVKSESLTHLRGSIKIMEQVGDLTMRLDALGEEV